MQTLRNHNSSRFGKWVDVRFDGDGGIRGGAVRTYLLEKSRVIAVPQVSSEGLELWSLMPPPPLNDQRSSPCGDSGEVVRAVIPTIAGRAWVTAHSTMVCDPTDPFPEGYTVGDIW